MFKLRFEFEKKKKDAYKHHSFNFYSFTTHL